MKKQFLLLLLTLSAVLLSASEYKFLAIGDLHYDGEAYHSAPPRDANKAKARKRNLIMWAEDGKAGKVLSAAAKMSSADMPFVIQLGDLTEGDCETPELLQNMLAGGFAKVKSYFPDNKLLVVKGNHDRRVLGVKGGSDVPAAKGLLPLVAKELDRKEISGNYAVRQGKDLFLFFDAFTGRKEAVEFVRKSLADNPDTRYVFFSTHLPVLPCSIRNPAWLIPGRKEIIPMLAKRNTIILSAHTHEKSFISLGTPEGKLSQLIVCSIGYQWNPKGKPKVNIPDYAAFCKRIMPNRINLPNVKKLLADTGKYAISAYEVFSYHAGFAIIKVNDRSVTAEIYTGNSGKPWCVRTLCENPKQKK